MTSFLIATRNPHKTQEFREILGPDFEVHDLTAHPEIPETAESGTTFAENAVLKATTASKQYPGTVLADDSGLEVDALGGGPGVFSARYAGEKATAQENLRKLLQAIAGSETMPCHRDARFRCLLALARHGTVLGIFEGMIEGTIIESPRGSGGFGYDPIFVPNGFDQSFAELPEETKNRISHRAGAVAQMRQFLKAQLR